MYPNLFENILGESFAVHLGSYRIMGVTASLYLLFQAGRLLFARLGIYRTAIAMSVIVTVFFIGSRLLYGLLYLPRVLDDPTILYALKLNNFTLFGGMALSLLAWWIISNKNKLPFIKITDILAPHVGISIAIMRIGCFLNGCCYGKTSEVPWAVTFPLLSPAHLAQFYADPQNSIFSVSPVHPTQLYEMVVALLASTAAWFVGAKNYSPGMATAIFGLVLTAGRFITFYFRDFPVASDISNIIRGPVVYGTAFVVFLFWAYNVYTGKKSGRCSD